MFRRNTYGWTYRIQCYQFVPEFISTRAKSPQHSYYSRADANYDAFECGFLDNEKIKGLNEEFGGCFGHVVHSGSISVVQVRRSLRIDD